MRISRSSSSKVFLPALLAMATMTLQAQQSTPAPASAATPAATAAQSGNPQSEAAQPGAAQSTNATSSGGQSGSAQSTPAQNMSGQGTTPEQTNASQQGTTQIYDNGPDQNGKKHKKDKKSDKADADAPTAEELAAAQDTAIRARKDTAPQPGSDGVMPGVKKGSIDDVNASGTRDIGARGLGNWYSTESEIKEGKAVSMELEKSAKFINDPIVTEYVNRVGQNIVKNSDAKVPFTIRVIDTDVINAMALPGGYFYVNSGLILAADNEAELAGVMAHEIAHVAAHHQMREQTRLNYMQFSTIPLIFLGGGLGYGLYEASGLAIPVTFLKFSRDFEAQADFLGIQYMYRSGYDPEALPSMFEKLEHIEKTKPNLFEKTFSDHPQTPDRILATQREIQHLLPPREEYIVNTSEFDDVKARLARIENKRKLRDGGDSKKPSLRRASTSPDDQNNPNGQSGDDDRPTLHRRDN